MKVMLEWRESQIERGKETALYGIQNCMNISDLWQRFDFNFQQKVCTLESTNCKQMT